MRVIIIGRGARGQFWEQLVTRHRATVLTGTLDPDPAAGASWDALGTEALAQADGAIIASPPALHVAHALACLEAGLAVLVEKPLALTLADARTVADAARHAGRPVVVAQNFAERGLERAVESALRHMGPLRAGIIVSSRARSVTPGHLVELEHPILWDFAIHHFDLIRRRAGAPPDSVRAEHFGDVYRASFHWSSGIEVSWWHDDGSELFHRAEWWRSGSGAVEVRGERAWRALEGRRPRRLLLGRGSAEARLLEALVSGESNIEQNLGTVAMTVAVESAIDAGGQLELADVSRSAAS